MHKAGGSPGDRRLPLLQRGLEALGLQAAPGVEARLLAYLDELITWNAAYNLTAVRDPLAMVPRHLLDSLAVVPQLDAARRVSVLDVGAGAGLPGLVLAIWWPELPVTVLDSNGKKARFMRHAVRKLGLANVQVAEARVEGWQPEQPFATVISRAFASLADFVEMTRPLLAEQGRWLAMKGRPDPDERRALPPWAQIESDWPLHVPGLEEARHLVVLRDAGSTAAGLSVGLAAQPASVRE